MSTLVRRKVDVRERGGAGSASHAFGDIGRFQHLAVAVLAPQLPGHHRVGTLDEPRGCHSLWASDLHARSLVYGLASSTVCKGNEVSYRERKDVPES